jgi:hypothetical protein
MKSTAQSPLLRPFPALTVTIPPFTDVSASTVKQATPGNRCPCCRKKLLLTDMACRCGIRHCQVHRHPESHACTHDFKSQGRAILATQLESCVGAKIEKI